MKAIPMAMRQRILELYNKGSSTRDIAAAVGFCEAAVRRVRQQFQIGSGAGDCAPAPSHTTGRAVFRIRRLNAAAFLHGGCKV